MNYNHVYSIKEWFEEAVQLPSGQNRRVQLGCHFEENVELLEELSSRDDTTQALLFVAKTALHNLAEHLKNNPADIRIKEGREVAVLDALCDQMVTAIGVGHMFDFRICDAIQEVDESNWSKFDEAGKAIFTAEGKIAKGPGYFKPELDIYV